LPLLGTSTGTRYQVSAGENRRRQDTQDLEPTIPEYLTAEEDLSLQTKGGCGANTKRAGAPVGWRGFLIAPSEPTADVRVTDTERKVAELLLQQSRFEDIACILGCASDTLKGHIHNIYVKFELRGDGVHCPVVQLAMIIHEQRRELGVRCQACGEM